jgi:hypothetical protein
MDNNIYNTCNQKSLLQSVGPYKILNTSDFPQQLKVQTNSHSIAPIILNETVLYGETISITYIPQLMVIG